MHRLLMLIPAVFAAMITLVPEDASAGNVTYNRPKIDGYRLDWCRQWARNCGQPAADAFCRRLGWTRSVGYRIDHNIGRYAPTKVIGTGQLCRDGGCDGFRFVVCERRRAVAPPPPPPPPPVNSSRRFRSPVWNGFRLDWCYRWARNCGRTAANAYCQRKGYRRAIRWRKANNIGRFGPTRVIGTNQVCRGAHCDGFRYIDCAGTRGVRPPRPAVQTRTFSRPRLGRLRLDWCYRWGVGCGKRAANAYCRRVGYRYATTWRMARDIGRFGPTRIIGSRKVCRGNFCDGFRFITCRR